MCVWAICNKYERDLAWVQHGEDSDTEPKQKKKKIWPPQSLVYTSKRKQIGYAKDTKGSEPHDSGL